MRTHRTYAGPFSERPFYSDDEIERICTNALAETGLLPEAPSPTRIDRFVEKRFNARIIYEPMQPSILGFTEFSAKGVEAVHIAQPPEGKRTKSAERLMNSTLAHEAGHGLMHAHLFALGLDHAGLFDKDPDVSQTRVMCREGNSNVTAFPRRKYDGRWWELQANRAIGALLMPKKLFLSFMETFMERQGALGLVTLPATRRSEATSAVADAFDVNPAAANVRINQMFPEQGPQLTF